MKANHKKMNVPITTGKGQTVVTIERGQFIFGRLKAAEELDMKPSTVRNIMEKLEKLQNLDMQKDSHYSIVTICNYNVYQNLDNYKGQAKGQPKDNQRTTKGQPKDTNNNENNDNNEKNNITSEFKNSSVWPPEDLWLYNLIHNQKIFTDAQKEYLSNHEWWEDLDKLLSGMSEDFINKQFIKMKQWKHDNKRRWPTAKGITRFTRTWLEKAKEQERRKY